jgi:hypothetical protein
MTRITRWAVRVSIPCHRSPLGPNGLDRPRSNKAPTIAKIPTAATQMQKPANHLIVEMVSASSASIPLPRFQ